jgi:hypothetical protein
MPELEPEGDDAGVLDADGLDDVAAGPGAVAQPESHDITAIRQIDVNFMGNNWLWLNRQRWIWG